MWGDDAYGREKAAALEAHPDGAALVEDRRGLLWANRSFARMHGYRDGAALLEAAAGRPWTVFLTPADRRRLQEILPGLGSGDSWRGELAVRRGDGGIVSREVVLCRLEGSVLAVLVRDDVERRRFERALAAREELFRLLADNASDLIALHEPDGTWVYVSPSVSRLLGYEEGDLLGRVPWDLAQPDHRERLRNCLLEAAAGRPGRVTCRMRTNRGEHIWLETVAEPVRRRADGPGSGGPFQVESSSRDVTERKRLERQLAHQALHEPLTGLANRTLFMNRLDQAQARARRSGKAYAILFLDLDDFKAVNDRLGHAAGDDLLISVARRLEGAVRDSDTVARLGGDEFGVLLEEMAGLDALSPLVERVERAFEEAFPLGEERVAILPSIGVALSRRSEEPEEVLLRADQAMYRAKRAAGDGQRTRRAFFSM